MEVALTHATLEERGCDTGESPSFLVILPDNTLVQLPLSIMSLQAFSPDLAYIGHALIILLFELCESFSFFSNKV